MIYAPALDGIGKSLLNFLSSVDFSRTEIHLGLFKQDGPLLSLLPLDVVCHIVSGLDDNFPPPSKQVLQDSVQRKDWKTALLVLFLLLHCKVDGSPRPYFRYLFRNVQIPSIRFDEAHAFHGPWQIIDYCVCEKIKAKTRFGWIHVDVSRMPIDESLIKKLYKKYKSIFIVSKEAKSIFDIKFPQFKQKTQVRIHRIDRNQVDCLALKGPTFADDFTGKRILTVGRIAPEKGQQDAILALSEIIRERKDIHWYFIGDGKDIESCQALAKRLGVQNYLSFPGAVENPYRFMKDCDLYVQPSRHEGFCISLAEALCFDVPIVATPFTGAKEQLEGRPGTRVVGVNADTLSRGILDLLSQQNER